MENSMCTCIISVYILALEAKGWLREASFPQNFGRIVWYDEPSKLVCAPFLLVSRRFTISSFNLSKYLYKNLKCWSHHSLEVRVNTTLRLGLKLSKYQCQNCQVTTVFQLSTFLGDIIHLILIIVGKVGTQFGPKQLCRKVLNTVPTRTMKIFQWN
jgi:hypothetical protein